ncbi:MAG: hypothetical protein QOI54_760 [Actinomycetota bacterium]|jgi:hypothetical protein|nr:hypothetical protein [Actinomycetota bacterium]
MTQHMPPKRQSIRPPRVFWLALAAVVLGLSLVWLAVTLATGGPSNCPADKSNGSSNNCQ